MRHGLTLALLLGAALIAAACTDRLDIDPGAAAVSRSPLEALERPEREDRRYWLLLGFGGWCSSHVTRFGGDADDPGVAIVRVARFDSDASAIHAFAKMDPAYLYRIFRVKMLRPPQYILFAEPLPGDQSFVIAYDARLPFELPEGQSIEGQMIAVRSGRFVTVIENIGVPAEQITAAVGQITRAAEQQTEPGC